MRVLIIPEDPTLDQHVLKPVVERVFADLGRSARVDVLRDPHLSGIDQALEAAVVRGIIDDHKMIDLFILAVDRDCDRFANSAKASARESEHPGKLVAVLAQQEVEVWALALHRSKLRSPWREVTSCCDPKEEHWDPFVAERGWIGTVGKGRKRAMRDIGAGWGGLVQVCPEIADLRDRVRPWVGGTP